LRTSLLALFLVLLPSGATAAEFGLALSSPTPEADNPFGPAIVAVPPRLPNGQIDGALHDLLVQALTEQYGDRVVSAQATKKAIAKAWLKPAELWDGKGIEKLAKAVEAERAVAFFLQKGRLLVRVWEDPKLPPSKNLTLRIKGRIEAKEAKTLVARIRSEAGTLLTPPLRSPPPEVAKAPAPPATDPAGATADPVSEETNPASDVELEVQREAERDSKAEAAGRPILLAAVGAGTGFRSLETGGSGAESLAPIESGSLPAVSVFLSFAPLELAPKIASAPWADVVLEGHFRRGLVQGRTQGAEGDPCAVDDDELLLRAGWRYRLGPGLPSVGLGAGWGLERTRFCGTLPVVSTDYRALGIQLRAQQLLLEDRLGIELLGGPRFVLAGAEVEPGSAFDAELWVSYRFAPFFGRAGGRVSRTQMTGPSVEITDLRTQLALELGASL